MIYNKINETIGAENKSTKYHMPRQNKNNNKLK